MKCNTSDFVGILLSASKFFNPRTDRMDTPEGELWLCVLKGAIAEATKVTPKGIDARHYLMHDPDSEWIMEQLGLDCEYVRRMLVKWGIDMYVTQDGTKMMQTWTHTWEEIEKQLKEGKPVLGLQKAIQKRPDFKVEDVWQMKQAKQTWLKEVPYAYQRGYNVPAHVYENWKQHKENYNNTKKLLAPLIPSLEVAMQKPRFTWSYSALNDFENCPLAYAHKRYYKDIKQEDTIALIDGRETHKGFETYLKQEPVQPHHLELIKPCQHIADYILNASKDGTLLVERQLCFTETLALTDWFGDDAWWRLAIDVALIKGNKAWIFDWKTGDKVKEDPTQLKIFCAGLAIAYKEIEEFTAKNIWTKYPQAGEKIVITRKELLPILQELFARVKRMREAWENEIWQARKSGLCRKHCAVTACPHCGRR